MLIWKGHGFLVPLIVLITLSITEGFIELITKDNNFIKIIIGLFFWERSNPSYCSP